MKQLTFALCFQEVEDILFWKSLWNFRVSYFTPGNSRQNKVSPLAKLCFTPWKKNPRPRKFYMVFSLWHLEIPLRFKLNPGNSAYYFFDTSRNSIFSTLPPLLFFWNSPMLFWAHSKTFTSHKIKIKFLKRNSSIFSFCDICNIFRNQDLPFVHDERV